MSNEESKLLSIDGYEDFMSTTAYTLEQAIEWRMGQNRRPGFRGTRPGLGNGV